MSNLRLLTTAALSSASILALATPAAAVTSNLPRIQGYQDAGSVCRINYSFRVTGTENDIAVNDVYQEQLVDTAQNTLAQRPLRSVQNGLSNSVTTQIDIAASSIPAASAARGRPVVAIYDTDASGTRQQIQGNVFVDLAQMNAAGGQCAQVAQAFGFGAVPNDPPVADAGPDQNVPSRASIALNGNGSTDPDGDVLTYSWTQVSGPTATITDANTATPTVRGPSSTASPQMLEFELTVDDGRGGTSTDRVVITVAARGASNNAPVADAGTDMTVAINTAGVNLNAGGSSDPDGDALTYQWTQTAGTTVNISGATSSSASFDAPATAQTLTFDVTVTDPDGLTSTDSVNFTITANNAPVANAGTDQNVDGNSGVTLSGSTSSDPDGDTLTYTWTQTAGPTVILNSSGCGGAVVSGPQAARTSAARAAPAATNCDVVTFTAPAGTANAQTLEFELTVDDGNGGTSTDTVAVVVAANTAPIANAGPDQGPIDTGNTVTLNGGASSDPEGDALTYSWTQISGTSVSLSGASSANPTFTAPPVNGTENLTFRLVVNDGQANSVADTVTVSIRAIGNITIIQKVQGADRTFSYTSTVSALNGSVATQNGTGQIQADNISAGSYAIAAPDLREAGYALTSISCNDSDSVVDLAGRSVALELSPNEDLVCIFTSVNSRSAADQTITNFLTGRNALILANQPDLQRRLDRLTGTAGSGGTATAYGVPIPGSGSLPMSAMLSAGRTQLSTSLQTVAAAAGAADRGNLPFDVWAEATFSDARLGTQRGSFDIYHIGADYRVGDDLLVGVSGQFDRFNDRGDLEAGEAEGKGWLVGPYVMGRIAPNLYGELRAAWGRSDNTLSSTGAFIDEFDTDRALYSGSLIGVFDLEGGTTIRPEMTVRYLDEKSEGYIDTLGVTIFRQKVGQGDIAFSPRIQHTVALHSGWKLRPFAEMEGIYTFGTETNVVLDNGLRARIEGGLDLFGTGAFRASVSGFHDGVGEEGLSNSGVTASISFGF